MLRPKHMQDFAGTNWILVLILNKRYSVCQRLFMETYLLYNTYDQSNVDGIDALALMPQLWVTWKYCNGVGNTNARGMKERVNTPQEMVIWS